ncbi:Cytoplasmic axial filament protein CafA and Ribonuclease G [Luteococcus japonicus LSP_Lj1]|uniref:Ribonuclease E n=1 Tax=Luteococcus japonicus LSP_Lj1 TaxID=1255658 RepID=A0A1R4IRL0_9ACTN|nr:Cytoplasmic axial filament protein CafA and Ribonuclease G [Luteococcus japonicus LSP_Lj1]
MSEAEVPITQAAGTASVVVAQDTPSEEPAKPKRRRATRKAGAVATKVAQTPSSSPETVEMPAEANTPAEPAMAEPTNAVAEPATSAEPVEARPTRRRTRKTAPKVEAVEAPGEPSVETTEPAAAPADTESTVSQTQEAAAPAEPAETRPTRRRRSRKSVEAPAENAPADVDEALAAVTAAVGERPRRGRRVAKSVANPFVSPQLPVDENGEVDAQAVLDSLAASIAAGDQAPVVPDAPVAEQVAVDPEDIEPEHVEAEDIEAEDIEAEDIEAEDVESESDQDVEDVEETEAATADEESSEQDGDEDSDDESSEDNSDDSASDEEEGGSRRRRRRRGGRRRRRGQDQSEDAQDQDSDESGDQNASESDDDRDSEDQDNGNQSKGEESDEQGSESGRRRRRRRRRRGEDAGAAEDDPSEVVVRVREPRRIRTAAQANDEVTGIDGSTRMEAKKQRRREGRAAGRRRTPILSEAEFLARREAVDRRMVIRQNDEYTQLAVLEDDILVEHYVDRASSSSLIGNIYLGRVQNVLPSMEAAFIDIGRGRNAVLYAGEIDWDQYGAAGEHKKVEQVLKSGQTVLVQVSKDPVGAKGARLTSHISLPGRYVVYSPGGHLSGISRKLADAERHRLKDILGDLIDDKSSVIVRTAAEGASEDELVRDVNRLKAQWEIIEKKSKSSSAPAQLYAEPDLTVRIVRDLFTEDFSELVVSGNGGPEDAYEAINGYVTHVAPHLAERLTKWDTAEQGDPFAKHKIDEQIAKALERKVFLPSGGSLVIDRTEAMTVIDVNTGKFTGTGGNLEATVTSNNLEAAEEVVRQLRLRDIGGIIVIDFIDMVLPSNRELLLRRLVECLGRDRTRHQVAEVTSLGLVQMTRKKIGTGLAEAFTEECSHCGGRGYARHDHPVETQAPADGGDRHHGGGGRRGRRSNNH